MYILLLLDYIMLNLWSESLTQKIYSSALGLLVTFLVNVLRINPRVGLLDEGVVVLEFCRMCLAPKGLPSSTEDRV